MCMCVYNVNTYNIYITFIYIIYITFPLILGIRVIGEIFRKSYLSMRDYHSLL